MTDSAEIIMQAGATVYDSAVDLVRHEKKWEPMFIQRRLGLGVIVTGEILGRMEREGIVSRPNSKGTREVL